MTNGGDGWLHDEFGRSCGLYAQRVRSRISFAQAQAPLSARIRSDVVHRRCFFLAAASKRDLAWLEFEGKARTHNKYNINAMQYKREYCRMEYGIGKDKRRETGSLVRSWRFSSSDQAECFGAR